MPWNEPAAHGQSIARNSSHNSEVGLKNCHTNISRMAEQKTRYERVELEPQISGTRDRSSRKTGTSYPVSRIMHMRVPRLGGLEFSEIISRAAIAKPG